MFIPVTEQVHLCIRCDDPAIPVNGDRSIFRKRIMSLAKRTQNTDRVLFGIISREDMIFPLSASVFLFDSGSQPVANCSGKQMSAAPETAACLMNISTFFIVFSGSSQMPAICALHTLTTRSFSIRKPFQTGGGLFGVLTTIIIALITIRTAVVKRRNGAMFIEIPKSSAAMMVPAAVMLLPISHQSDRCEIPVTHFSASDDQRKCQFDAVNDKLHGNGDEQHTHQAVDCPVFPLADSFHDII